MKRIIRGSVVGTHDLIMRRNSKIYATGLVTPNALLLGMTKEEMGKIPGEHIEGDIVVEAGDVLIVDGNVLGMNGGKNEAGCVVRHITKEQFERAANGEEVVL